MDIAKTLLHHGASLEVRVSILKAALIEILAYLEIKALSYISEVEAKFEVCSLAGLLFLHID